MTHQTSGLHEANVLGGEESTFGGQLVVLELSMELCQFVLQDVELIVAPLHFPVKLVRVFSCCTSGENNITEVFLKQKCCTCGGFG